MDKNWSKENYTIDDLKEIMAYLRSENGCPWDKEQTHKSLAPNMIEETYEAIEAIDSGNTKNMIEELGDVLLQVIFHSCIGEEEGSFSLDDVINAICNKLVVRHTHVFGDDKADTSDEVLINWAANKQKEKEHITTTSRLKDIPKGLPALMHAAKVQKKAADVGFDWDNVMGALQKTKEEIDELEVEIDIMNQDRIEDELGDVLFSIVNIARFLKVEPEQALTGTINKFIKRFEKMENYAETPLKDMSLEQMDVLWERAKENLYNK